jgi:NAD+ synthase (glutamine-hydrolysing)
MQMHERFGYCRVGAAVPVVRPGAVSANISSMAALAKKASEAGADVLVFPELCVTGYTCADLFFQPALLDAAEKGLELFLKKIWQFDTVFILGLPVRQDGLLYNCAVVCRQGNILGVVPKTHLPNTREFYEKRWFSSAVCTQAKTIRLCGEEVPFGADLIFQSMGVSDCCVGVEICEDLWSPIPPCTRQALNGATVLCNLSASNELVGKHAYRRELVSQQSARCLAAYVYAGAGPGESSTDLVFGGQALIAENGRVLAENRRFEREANLVLADVDLAFLKFERRQNAAYAQCASQAEPARKIVYDSADEVPVCNGLMRTIDRHPFVPADEPLRASRCEEVFAIQSTGLATRLLHAGCHKVVVGLSGGLDSALALLVICEAFERAGFDRSGICAITLPGFGTTERTLGNTVRLCGGLGVSLEQIDITAACKQHLADIGHSGQEHDVAYENTQARERTQILMNKANMLGALVVGTGDLSELALGWCTYNGDHMSMYGVNSGVPKTLVRYLVQWVAEHRVNASASAALTDILATPVSPELLPADKEGQIAQKTEEVIGPYELHDFFLYHFVRCGATYEKIRFLAETAFKNSYTAAEIDRWLKLFFARFFSQQFKRSCMPDGPKVGSINLSPRGDWRMPSDASAEVWLP